MISDVSLVARWAARLEDRAACNQRCARFFELVHQIFHNEGTWHSYDLGHRLAVDHVKCMRQTLDSTDVPMEQLGWKGTFSLSDVPSVIVKNEWVVRSEIICGASTPHRPTPNLVSMTLAASIREDLIIYRQIVSAMLESFEPDMIELASGAARGRTLKLRLSPTIDWMVWLADVVIPPKELTLASTVERVGTGTLVVLKLCPVDPSNAEDQTLIAAIEPVIRRYQKAALMSNHSKQKSIQ
jgi:hypothetical protein